MDMLLSVSISNTIGIVLMLMLLITNQYNFFERKSMVYIFILTLVAMLSCGADIAAYSFDGMQGRGFTVLIYFLNTWLFLANITMSSLWVIFLHKYIGVTFGIWKKRLYALILGVGILILILNLFFPIVFTTVDNVYQRLDFYWIYVAIGGLFLLDGVLTYYATWFKSGKMISFPVLVFIIPVFCGVLIQSLFYGVSLVWVSVAIAIVGMVSAIKNEMIYVDQLTGLYNRFFLGQLRRTLSKQRAENISGLMVDLNDFKSINDRFGHAIGDEALKRTADILMEVIGTKGRVIRYAGDEFVVLINTTDQAALDRIIRELHAAFAAFNARGNNLYTLSASVGCHCFHIREQSLEEFIHVIDAEMYKNKQEYHRAKRSLSNV